MFIKQSINSYLCILNVMKVTCQNNGRFYHVAKVSAFYELCAHAHGQFVIRTSARAAELCNSLEIIAAS